MLYQTVMITALVTTMVFVGIMKFLQLKALMWLRFQHGKYVDLATSVGELVLSAIFWPIVAALQYIARLVPTHPELAPAVVEHTVGRGAESVLEPRSSLG